MRLIDADALKEELVKRTPHFAQRIEFTPCFDAIRNAPTVDAVPVDELKNRDVRFHDKGKAFDVFFPIGLDLDAVNEVEIRGRKFVPVKSIEQLKWERDTAIEQLEEHGIPFCGKAEDVVPVVRCKECKHRPTKPDDYNPITTDGFALEFPDEKCPCQCEDGWYSKYPDDDWYCADGERREE